MSIRDSHAPLDLPDTQSGRTGAAAVSRRHASYPFERSAIRQFLRLIGNPPLTVELWDGEKIIPSNESKVAHVRLKDRRALYNLILRRDVGIGDEYSTGRLEIEGNLVEMLQAVYRAESRSQKRTSVRSAIAGYLAHRRRFNSPQGSRQNILHHYDIGNDFYKLWLDAEMQYTCAYFPTPDLSIEEAQRAKMDHVCRKLQLKAGDRVVEAGCGWGSLARHMAKYYGAKVTAYNISHEQVAFATERARAEGLDGQLEYVEDDYRNISGEFDAFVSVGMLEHVGKTNFGELGRVMNECLAEDGRALLHSIGRNQPMPMNAWTEKRIFPGAYPPTLREIVHILEPYDFSVLDVENLRLHYAKTLEHWLDRYERALAQVVKMFDENFARAWRLYLAGSIAAFYTSSLQLFQVVAARGSNNGVQWTREHLYR